MQSEFDNLIRDILDAGEYAAAKQSTVSRNIKKDGTILTKTDTELDKILGAKIKEYFPGSVVVSEEDPLPSEDTNTREWIFTLDPIDGTDSYSQGMPGWCVAVGILDPGFTPVGAIVYAPRWGTEAEGGNLLTLMPGGIPRLNGKDLDSSGITLSAKISPYGQIMMGSGLHSYFDYGSYKNKLRVSGSAIINICSPIFHSEVRGSVIPPCYIWDVAPAHAVIRKAGMDLEYYSGGKIDYKIMADRSKAPDHFVSGNPETRALIRSHFKLK